MLRVLFNEKVQGSNVQANFNDQMIQIEHVIKSPLRRIFQTNRLYGIQCYAFYISNHQVNE